MPCVFEQSYYIGFFYDLACIHNDDSIAHLCYYAHVMGNQKNRGVLPLLISRIRSSICACTVTSSAVVGSSAIRSFGVQASAIAIMTLCRIPPDS